MKQVSVVVDRDRERVDPLHGAIIDADAVSTVHILMWDAGRATPTTLARYDADEAEVAAMLDDVDIVDSYRVRSAPGRRGTYGFVWQERFHFEPYLSETFGLPAVLIVPPVVFRGDGALELTLVGTAASLRELAAMLDDAVDYAVTAAGDYHGPGRGGSLTDRQREALRAAVDVGYYDVPRTGDVADVAECLDCAESTASELVRKAQSAVVRGYVR
jgi:hypothetical protein